MIPAIPPSAPVRLSPGNVKVATLGDSWMQKAATASTTTAVASSTAGLMSWVQALDPRYRHENWINTADPYARGFTGANFGLSGDSAAGILARMAATLATNPNVILLDSGFNDMSGVLTADQVVASLTSALDMAVRKGVAVLYLAIWSPTTGNWAAASDARYKAANVNRQMRYECARRRRCLYLDTNSIWSDPTGTVLSAAPKTNYAVSDGVHPSVRGGFYIARDLVLPALQSLFPTRAADLISCDDIYHATKNPYGMMTQATYASSNPFMTGSVSATGTGASGNRATNLTIERATGGAGTVACSKNADGSQRVVLTPPASGNETFYLRWPNFAHGLPVGTWVQAFAKVGVTAWDGFIGCLLQCEDVEGTVVSKALDVYDPSGDDTGLFPAENMTLYLATPPIQIASANNLRVRLAPTVRGGKSGTGTLDIYHMAARPVPDPRPFWGY